MKSEKKMLLRKHIHEKFVSKCLGCWRETAKIVRRSSQWRTGKDWKGLGQGPRGARALISCLIKRTPKRAASCRGKKPTHCENFKACSDRYSPPESGDSLASLSSFSSLLLLPLTPHSCFVVLRLRANTVDPVYMCICTDFTCTVCRVTSVIAWEKERETDRKRIQVCTCVGMYKRNEDQK